jgi:hypothetical protein
LYRLRQYTELISEPLLLELGVPQVEYTNALSSSSLRATRAENLTERLHCAPATSWPMRRQRVVLATANYGPWPGTAEALLLRRAVTTSRSRFDSWQMRISGDMTKAIPDWRLRTHRNTRPCGILVNRTSKAEWGRMENLTAPSGRWSRLDRRTPRIRGPSENHGNMPAHTGSHRSKSGHLAPNFGRAQAHDPFPKF